MLLAAARSMAPTEVMRPTFGGDLPDPVRDMFRPFRIAGWCVIGLSVAGAAVLTWYALFRERWDIADSDGSWNGVIIGYGWCLCLVVFGRFLARGERSVKDAIEHTRESKKSTPP